MRYINDSSIQTVIQKLHQQLSPDAKAAVARKIKAARGSHVASKGINTKKTSTALQISHPDIVLVSTSDVLSEITRLQQVSYSARRKDSRRSSLLLRLMKCFVEQTEECDNLDGYITIPSDMADAIKKRIKVYPINTGS